MDGKKGKRILIVEDEHQIAHLLEQRLKRLGFNVLLAYTGEAALKLIEKDKPNLILLDVMLPGIDGYSVLRQIRQHEHSHNAQKQVPVIMQSARGLPTEILCESEGISGYVRKPYEITELLGAISEALDEEEYNPQNG
ncbi:MAG: response regulator [Candidatus Omnitrophica bacterium]|nr:response regulator [Candidatus Omnitrophota bacterium]